MDGEGFRAARERIGVTQEVLGRAIKAAGGEGSAAIAAIDRWEVGIVPVPGPVATLMTLLAEVPEARKHVGLEKADAEKPKQVAKIEWTPQSSNIQSVSYDGISTLTVTFKNGGSGDYLGVPAPTVEAFKQAKSAGGFLAEHIKSTFEYVKHGQENAEETKGEQAA